MLHSYPPPHALEARRSGEGWSMTVLWPISRSSALVQDLQFRYFCPHDLLIFTVLVLTIPDSMKSAYGHPVRNFKARFSSSPGSGNNGRCSDGASLDSLRSRVAVDSLTSDPVHLGTLPAVVSHSIVSERSERSDSLFSACHPGATLPTWTANKS